MMNKQISNDVNLTEQEDDDILSLKCKKKRRKQDQPTTTESILVNNDEKEYTYMDLLDRLYNKLRTEKKTNISTNKTIIIPPPQLSRLGPRKTIFTNFYPICELLKRNKDHFSQFISSELACDTSFDGQQRLVLKGRFLPPQIKNILSKYIKEYVICISCKLLETILTKDSVTRLTFLTCLNCNSKTSVQPIRAGFHATNKSDRIKQRLDTYIQM